MAPTLNLVIGNDLSTVANSIEQILGFVNSNHMMSNDLTKDLRLVLMELLVNAVSHGNSNNPNGNIDVNIKIDGDVVKAVISGDGEYRNLCEILNKAKEYNWSGNIEELYSESGRGLIIVNKLTDSLSCNLKGNAVSFTKKLR
jgi:anti-sigma regulatory factor (Ser/Thr protein kinase)